MKVTFLLVIIRIGFFFIFFFVDDDEDGKRQMMCDEHNVAKILIMTFYCPSVCLSISLCLISN